MNITQKPDIARLNGVWNQNSVPTEELAKLEKFTGQSLNEVMETLEAGNPDREAVDQSRQQSQDLKSLFAKVSVDLPDNTLGNRQYTHSEQIGGPGPYEFRWERRDHYVETTYHWQEQSRIGKDISGLRKASDKLNTLVAESLDKPGPVSEEEVQVGVNTEQVKTGTREVKKGPWWWPFKKTVTEDVFKEVKTPIMAPAKPEIEKQMELVNTLVHDLFVAGEKIGESGLHEEARVRRSYDAKNLRY